MAFRFQIGLILASALLTGCGSRAWYHPRSCAVKNATNVKIDRVELRLVTEKWKTNIFSLNPGEVKKVALPSGKIPNGVFLSWDFPRLVPPAGTLNFPMGLSFLGNGYQGDLLFTIYDYNNSRPKAEAVDLSTLGIVIGDSSAPDTDAPADAGESSD